jgi:hypothetical protein
MTKAERKPSPLEEVRLAEWEQERRAFADKMLEQNDRAERSDQLRHDMNFLPGLARRAAGEETFHVVKGLVAVANALLLVGEEIAALREEVGGERADRQGWAVKDQNR